MPDIPETPASDETVAELMARDPLKLSDQDLTKIIDNLRAKRVRFVVGDRSAGKPQAKKSAAQLKGEAALAAAGGKLDLSDLGL